MRNVSVSIFAAVALAACSSGSSTALQVACPSGETTCGNACVVLSTDTSNCGGCGTVCGGGQTCVAGTCTTSCPTGSLLCSSTCVEPRSDNLNCGSCNNVCTSGSECVDGGCADVVGTVKPTSCGTGLTTCQVSDGGVDGGIICVDTSTDSFNCQTCGHACPGGETCQDSLCVPSCLASELACGGLCTNPQTDRTNCGGCAGDGGVVCPAGQACTSGQCLATCASPLTACPGFRPTVDGGIDAGITVDAGNPDAGYCADLTDDPRDCGACGNVCEAGSYCLSGQCQLICPSSGQSCVTPLTLTDGGTVTGNSCCGSALAFSDGGCIADPSTLMVAYELPSANFLDTYTFQLTNGFVGTYTPGICLSQADLTDITCTNASSASFPAGGSDYLTVGQLDGGCGPFTLTVTVSTGF